MEDGEGNCGEGRIQIKRACPHIETDGVVRWLYQVPYTILSTSEHLKISLTKNFLKT